MFSKLAPFYADHRVRISRIAIWVAGLVALWTILAGLVLPPVLRHLVESRLSATLASNCSLERVRFNPFTLRLAAENLRIPLPSGEECFRLQRFEVRLSPASIYRFAPVLCDLKLTRPRLAVTLRQDGSLSSSDLAPAPQQAPVEQGESAPASAAESGRKTGIPFGLMVTDLEIRGGSLLFRDDIRQTKHALVNLELVVPFTSTLNRHRERPITPYLQAVVNGRPLRIDGRLVPFSEQLHTEFDIRLDNLDLPRFQPYLQPFTSAILDDGRLSTNFVFSIRQQPHAGLRLGLAGQLTLADLAVQSPQGAEALLVSRVVVDLDGSLNTQEGLTLKHIQILGPQAHLALLADGRLDWATWVRKEVSEETVAETATPSGISLPLHLKRLELRDGRVSWQDRKVKGGFQADADQIGFTVTDLHLPSTSPATLSADLLLNRVAKLSLEGVLLPNALQGDIRMDLQEFPLAEFQPYLAASGIPVTLEQGLVSASGRLEMAEGKKGTLILFKEGKLNLQDLVLQRQDTGKVFFRMGQMALAGLTVDPDGRRLEADQLLLDGPDLHLRRDRQGNIDLLHLRPAAPSLPAAKAATPSAAPWLMSLSELQLQNGKVAVALQGTRETKTALFEQLAGSITDYSSASRHPLKISLSGREKQGGSLSIEGSGVLDPLNMDLLLRTKRLNLQPFSPLLGQFNPALRLGSGALSLYLRTGLHGGAGKTRTRVRGQVTLSSLSLLEGRGEFAAFRTLRVRDLDIQPARQRYVMGEVSLVSPQLKLTVDAAGKNNLSRLFGGDSVTPAQETAPAAKQKTAIMPYLRIGGVKVSEGTLSMRDETYKPAVSNRLDNLTVNLGAFENTPESRAPITLAGALNGAAISGDGEFNPLLADIAVELRAQLHALDLAHLSPMSERFIAYPLRGGTFSLDSKVAIDQGRLDSSHRIGLDSMKLGAKLSTPDAPDIPVKLGISLLQDSAGNIDLTLPVRGDLRDPGFSIGGVVFKVISNLLVKAVASPFTFLGGLLGGAEAGLEFIPFEPGDGRLLAENAQAVATIADLLMKRPKINLVLIPQADEQDRSMLAEAYVRRRMQEMKYAALPEAQRAEVQPQNLPVGSEVDAEEYADLLFDIYAEQPFDKPKNFIGMISKLPPLEMMEAIREHYPNDDHALEQLALERVRHLREAFIALHPELESRISVQRPQVPSEGHRVTFGLK